jgi:nitrogen fixation/metabolism regulation signal transduction histidine kinase
LQIEQDSESVRINVSDSGNGILKNNFKTVFEPGLQLKKRGWGLGFLYKKRIVEEYHKGKLKF